jgi:hypothetical protein
MLDFSWSLPVSRIIRPAERLEYRISTMTDERAFRPPEGTAATRLPTKS